MNCIHCAYWGQDPVEIEDGASEYIPYLYGFQACHHKHVGGGSYLDDTRREEDSLSCGEQIETGPFFGCKHFTDKRV